jgi:hypothetical protein
MVFSSKKIYKRMKILLFVEKRTLHFKKMNDLNFKNMKFYRFERKSFMEDNKYPEYIYHYTKAENLFLILPKIRLKLNVISKTNDPVEVQDYFEYQICSGKTKQFSPYDLGKIIVNYDKATIVCFSGNDIKKGYNLPTMWAHYAENFKGVALKIHTKTFLKENSKFEHFYPVEYLTPGAIKSIMYDEECTPCDMNIIKAKLYRKREEWFSENEWRLSSIKGEEFCTIKNSLNSIILGKNFNLQLLPAIKELIAGINTKIEKLEIDYSTQNFYLETVFQKFNNK